MTRPTPGQGDEVRPRWIDGEMSDPWWRDWVAGITAEHADDLEDWAERIAATYGREGTLEVTACVWALLDRIDHLIAADATARTEER